MATAGEAGRARELVESMQRGPRVTRWVFWHPRESDVCLCVLLVLLPCVYLVCLACIARIASSEAW